MDNFNFKNLIIKNIVALSMILSVFNIANAAPTISTSIKVTATNTEDKALNLEVDANYSEIVGLKDCTTLEKRVTTRIDKVIYVLDKESNSIDTLIQKLIAIASDTAASGDATSTDILEARMSAINDKFDLVATTSDRYVRELRAIDTSKCQTKASSMKSQILATKPTYKDLLVADNNLKKYIKVDVKQTLIILKQDIASTTIASSTLSTSSVVETKVEKPDEKSLWGIVKSLFK